MKSTGNILLGLILLIIAALLITSAFGIIPTQVSSIIISWQSLLVAIGIYLFLKARFIGGMVILLTGIYFILPRMAYLGFNLPLNRHQAFLLIIALALLIFSFIAMTGYRFRGNPKFLNTKINTKGLREISCAFGDMNHTIVEKPFKGAKISTAFGGLKIDMCNTILPDGESLMTIENAFGETVISVPDNWIVEAHVDNVFGDFNDARSYAPTEGNNKLIIKGSNAFGSVKLIDVPSEIHNESNEHKEEKIENISIKQNNRVHIISLDELFYIQSDGDYVTLHTSKGNFLKEQTMKYFVAALPEEKFVRIHRSYIVNIAEITSVDSRGKDSYFVVLKNGESLRASVSGYQELKNRLDL